LISGRRALNAKAKNLINEGMRKQHSRRPTIARRSILTIVLFWSALAVAMRSGCTAKQASPNVRFGVPELKQMV
jgi:hypothetical protein